MIVTNIDLIPWKNVLEHYWLVSWSTVRSKHVWRDFMAWLKNIFGGELKWYTELMEESRKEAINRLVLQAQQLWANAVLNVRFATTSISAWAAEVYVYWTAVKVD